MATSSCISWIVFLVSLYWISTFIWISLRFPCNPYFKLLICHSRHFSLLRSHCYRAITILWCCENTFCTAGVLALILSHPRELLLPIFEFAIISMGLFLSFFSFLWVLYCGTCCVWLFSFVFGTFRGPRCCTDSLVVDSFYAVAFSDAAFCSEVLAIRADNLL